MSKMDAGNKLSNTPMDSKMNFDHKFYESVD